MGSKVASFTVLLHQLCDIEPVASFLWSSVSLFHKSGQYCPTHRAVVNTERERALKTEPANIRSFSTPLLILPFPSQRIWNFSLHPPELKNIRWILAPNPVPSCRNSPPWVPVGRQKTWTALMPLRFACLVILRLLPGPSALTSTICTE